jgi:copper(I)-binding protein
VNNTDGVIDVLGAVVVSSTEGQGTFVASLVNQDTENDDELVSVTGDEQSQVVVPVEIPAGSLVNLADMGAVSVTGERVAEGNFVRLTLEFKSGQETEVNVPVVPRDEEFSDVKTASTTAPAS